MYTKAARETFLANYNCAKVTLASKLQQYIILSAIYMVLF